MNSSAQISVCTPFDSWCDNNQAVGDKDKMNQSLDFFNLPALMQSLDEPDNNLAQTQMIDTLIVKPRFEYNSRAFNHYSVNKMTTDSPAFATINRGSFAEIDKNR